MHPNTMLARSAHELWHTDPESVIFLERNGERFQYVLDYLRDGRAYLPMGIPKEALMGDLEYYGLDSIDTNWIERKLTCAALVLQELRNEMCSWDVIMNATKMEMKALGRTNEGCRTPSSMHCTGEGMYCSVFEGW